MPILIILLLAFVQSVTEFLPVSSSGHLVLIESLLDLNTSNLSLNVFLHFATLLSVVVVFHNELRAMIFSLWNVIHRKNFKEAWEKDGNFRIVILIGIATVPTGIIGLFFHDLFSKFFHDPVWTSIFLMVTGLFLWFSNDRKQQPTMDILEMSVGMALILGLVQGVAILPGISRSGITIVAALGLGLHRSLAARFSFLMSIPAILGATLFEWREIEFGHWGAKNLFLGLLLAFIVGILAIHLVIKTVEKGRFQIFSYYVFPLGLFSLGYFILNHS